MDYSDITGGLARMLDRLQREGTATKDPNADAFLRENANAVLFGLLYDQRVLAETAFCGPMKLRDRLGHFDMRRIARMDENRFREVFSASPAVHRFTNTMADRTRAVARVLAEKYDGDARNIWADGTDLATAEKRVLELPGFGPLKVKKLKYALHYFGHRSFAESG